MDVSKSRTWAEISLGNLEHNYRALRACLEPGCRFLGVVKANAYGHGLLPVARRLEELGADYLAVACLSEAVELRRNGVTAPVLILGATAEQDSDALVEYGLTQSVFCPDQVEALSRAARRLGRTARVHLKADTGMSRLGVRCGDPEEAAAALAPLCRYPHVEAEGIFTHFAGADHDRDFTAGQFARFMDVLRVLKDKYGLEFEIRHCAASAAVLHYSCTHLDMVRPGLALYGHYPAPSCHRPDGPRLLPVMSLKTRTACVRQLPAGAAISYGGTCTLERSSRVAVLPIGYADGLFRSLSGNMQVLIRGRRAPQIGRICMDLCMADVTDVPGAQAGDEVTVFGPELPAEEKADLLGTIQYELLCAVSPRVPRIYL